MTNFLGVDPRLHWRSLSQQERNDAYDNNKASANSAHLIAERNHASAALRASRNAFLDVPYSDGERTKFDLYPGSDSSMPCFVFLHGGYWQRNSREVFAMLVEGIAAHGWSVAIPGYTLAPEARIAQIVAETHDALDWLGENGPEYGIAGPLILSGWSAGAQLAAMALGHPRVSSGLAISGVYDLAPIRDTALDTAMQFSDDDIVRFSPLRCSVVHKRLDIVYGTEELPALVHDAINFHALRVDADAPGLLMPVEGADHFSILGSLREKDGLLTKALLRLAPSPSI